MYVQSDTLDGLLRGVFETLLSEEKLITASRGDFKEVFGGCLHLTNPLARLSRSESKGKIYSALGEFLWYLSKENRLDFIDYYVPGRFQEESDDQVTVRSGYGERLQAWRGLNQLHNVVQLLQQHRTSRRATIQLFDATDIAERFASIPCTCTLQFLVRDDRLHMFVSMRSNDAYLGLPHDIFSFTMLQEMIARAIGVELGEYKHCAGSLHLYQTHFEAAEQYLKEGWQDPILMPAMPAGDPQAGIEWLQEAHPHHRRYFGCNPGQSWIGRRPWRLDYVCGEPDIMRWVGGSFIGMAIWTLIPDKIEEEETQVARHLDVFGATLVDCNV